MSQTINAFMVASKALLGECIHKVRDTDPETYAGLSKAMHTGAFAEIHCCLSVAGANEILLNIVLPDGERINLGHVEFDQVAH